MASKTPPFMLLRHEDKDLQVRIETEKEERLILTVNAAILACQASGHIEEFTKQFSRLRTKLSAWLEAHQQNIDKAYLTVRDAAILLLIVQKSEAFDQQFEDALTELDVEIAQDDDFHLVRLNVLALPAASEESIQSFLVSGSANL